MELVFLIFPLHTFVLFSRKAIFYFPKLDQPLFSRKREHKLKFGNQILSTAYIFSLKYVTLKEP